MALADKLKATVKNTRAKPQAYAIKDTSDLATKLLLYGHSGSGKTFFLVGVLLAGERILVLSTDFGGNGLLTVVNELKRIGRLDLLDNLRALDLAEYEDIRDFFDDSVSFVPDLMTFNPTVLVWEGFSYFNIGILDEYILSKAPGAEGAGELRHEGFTHTKQDWQGMKRGTVRLLGKFMAWTLPNGGKVHKILTCLEAQPEIDDLTQKSLRSVLVHGTGKALIGPPFDAVIETYKEEKKGGEAVEFKYRCEGASDKFLVKSRGFQLNPIENAEPERIWRILTGKEKSSPTQISLPFYSDNN